MSDLEFGGGGSCSCVDPDPPDVDELLGLLSKSQDHVLKFLSQGAPHVDIHFPKLHPRLFESGPANAGGGLTERVDSYEAEPLMQTVSRCDSTDRASSVGGGLPSRLRTPSDTAFLMAHHMELLAFEAAHAAARPSSARLCAVAAAGGLASLAAAAVVERQRMAFGDGLMSVAVSSAFVNTACLVYAWTRSAGVVFAVLTVVFSEVSSGVRGLFEQACAALLGPIEQLEDAIAKMSAEQAPAILLMRQLPESSFAADDLPEPEEMAKELQRSRRLLEAALEDARAESEDVLEELIADDHLGRLALSRPSFGFRVVLLPLGAAAVANVLAAVFEAKCLALLAGGPGLGDEPGEEGRTRRVGRWAYVLPAVQILLCAAQFFGLQTYWSKRKLCMRVNKALTELQRSFSGHIEAAVQTTVNHVYYEVFGEVRCKAANYFREQEVNLRNLQAMARRQASPEEDGL